MVWILVLHSFNSSTVECSGITWLMFHSFSECHFCLRTSILIIHYTYYFDVLWIYCNETNGNMIKRDVHYKLEIYLLGCTCFMIQSQVSHKVHLINSFMKLTFLCLHQDVPSSAKKEVSIIVTSLRNDYSVFYIILCIYW